MEKDLAEIFNNVAQPPTSNIATPPNEQKSTNQTEKIYSKGKEGKLER